MLLGKRYSSSLRLPFVSAFVPLVVSNFFPYFSVCIYCSSSIWARLDAQFSLFSICLLACLPCSLQVLSLVSCPIIDILLSGCLGKNGFPGLLCFALLFFFVQVSLLVSQLLCLSLNALGRNLFGLLYVTLPSVSTTCYPTCLSTWFPCPLSTTVLLSRSPALGRRGKDFCSSLSSLRTCSSNHSQFFLHFLSSLLLFILGALGALILLVSHLSPYLSPLFSPSSMLISILIAIL